MREYIVEKEFEHAGLKCVVVMQLAAHRCGYVGIDKKHPLYGKVRIETSFDVHGGIAYAGCGNGKYPIESDLWWFGFNCDHYNDTKDFETAKRLFADDGEAMKRIVYFENTEIVYATDGEIRTLDYVVEECKSLAEQLAKFITPALPC